MTSLVLFFNGLLLFDYAICDIIFTSSFTEAITSISTSKGKAQSSHHFLRVCESRLFLSTVVGIVHHILEVEDDGVFEVCLATFSSPLVINFFRLYLAWGRNAATQLR